MFAIPAILALLLFVYIRPQEIWTPLHRVPLIYVLVLLAAIGLALDLRLRFGRLRGTPLLPLAVANLAWCLVTMAVAARWALAAYGGLDFPLTSDPGRCP